MTAVDINYRGGLITTLIDSAVSNNFISKKRLRADIRIGSAYIQRARLAK